MAHDRVSLVTEGRLDAHRGPRPSVTHQVVNALCRMLRSGQYRVGDRLPSEQELGATLKVGRSAVREAARELITLDLLEIRAGRGTFVKSLRADLLFRSDSLGDTRDDAIRQELLEVRVIVEPEAAALAAERATNSDLERLAHDVAVLADAVGKGVRPREDVSFHLDAVRAAHNASLARVSSAIMSFYAWDGTPPTERDATEHTCIFEAVRDHDPQRARQLMLSHLVRDYADADQNKMDLRLWA